MRVDDYLLFAARLHRVPAAKLGEALAQAKQRCGLQDVGHKIAGTLSKGYQQRVGIAQAIIHHPAVVVLDEPTVGLDPAQIRDIRALIRELGDSSSVILSTHLLNEAESLCDRVIILQQGRVIFNGSSGEMMANGNMEEAFLQITEQEASGK
jgi:ABC-2 type transport system ATP-binding protein